VPVVINFKTKYDLRKNRGVLEPSTLKIGNDVAHLSGTYDVPADSDAVVLHVKAEGQNMPAKDLEAFLPAVGVHMPNGASLQTGTLNTNLELNGPTDRLQGQVLENADEVIGIDTCLDIDGVAWARVGYGCFDGGKRSSWSNC